MTDAPAFADTLREHRLGRRLTQAALAERAGLSERAISDLERGLKQPQRATVRLLIEALSLPPELAQAFELAAGARLPTPPVTPHGVRGAQYPSTVRRPAAALQLSDPQPESILADRDERQRVRSIARSGVDFGMTQPLTSFIGRERESSEIRTLLDAARLLTITGAGGIGKTRLALAVATQLSDRFEDGADCNIFRAPSRTIISSTSSGRRNCCGRRQNLIRFRHGVTLLKLTRVTRSVV
jgi:transcriptional regulator with XRE-family HTH domain